MSRIVCTLGGENQNLKIDKISPQSTSEMWKQKKIEHAPLILGQGSAAETWFWRIKKLSFVGDVVCEALFKILEKVSLSAGVNEKFHSIFDRKSGKLVWLFSFRKSWEKAWNTVLDCPVKEKTARSK